MDATSRENVDAFFMAELSKYVLNHDCSILNFNNFKLTLVNGYFSRTYFRILGFVLTVFMQV